MKKNFLTKVMALGMAMVMALTPVTAEAAEKKVVTYEEYMNVYTEAVTKANEDIRYNNVDEDTAIMEEHKTMYNFVKSLNGCYQENGLKIYTVLNGAKKTFKKTGKYSIVAGGTTPKKDDGTVLFKAPKTGTYKFTITANENVVGGSSANFFANNGGNGFKTCKIVYYDFNDKKVVNPNCAHYLLDDPRDGLCASTYKSSSMFDFGQDGYTSLMTKITFTCYLKKGQTAELEVRSSDSTLARAYINDPTYGYNFVGLDLDVKKVK